MSGLEDFIPQLTADNSFTFISREFNESFHSHFGARQESFSKFVLPTQLAEIAHKPTLRLLDICYGLGYNTAAALQTIWSVNPHCYVELIGLEINPAVPQAAIAHHLFDNWDYGSQGFSKKGNREEGTAHIGILSALAFEQQVQTSRLQGKLLINDARKSITQVHQCGFKADAIFLDSFSPPRCPQLWTVEFIDKVAQCLHSNGLLATYSCAAAVRRALLLAGLEISSTPPVGRRCPGTVAAHPQRSQTTPSSSLKFLPPLCQQEQEHLQTRAAIPYRDYQLQDPPHIIIMRRQEEQKTCSLEPTSRWRKRWLLANVQKNYIEKN
ncbi:tRNA (5-methylaminomethyl-2-thiouridine)(34)-methyltransferase MnmD [Umezakia ovalisporum]|uniref:MnmC family methyltransferase n=1 Tax=Umezakia ovalisporum FSS-43 TaxID=2740520 RepID=A0ABT6K7G6_9CYAN|nr:MnmC family methyltransferase [Umezakia ovalisporum]MDH6058279.1 MnmC family methyltransferase [Umezakia ovalisporum FSS-43]MDH6071368.1 MnmC family methyltransferase [Umezakia ovalisporum CobakiLakeA]MDH6083131.1 MnmC family methyltransferase [Umezakia ovalisporum FSS-44]MDH6095052.1 MnmC family methyltransferase [Umezakia ovalisporum CobakiLakeB]